jgi:hypothetical protein
MKQIITRSARSLTFFFTALLLSIVSFAQETKKIDIDVNTKSEDSGIFMQPWVWVVGGAVFILLLIALLRNNNK